MWWSLICTTGQGHGEELVNAFGRDEIHLHTSRIDLGSWGVPLLGDPLTGCVDGQLSEAEDPSRPKVDGANTLVLGFPLGAWDSFLFTQKKKKVRDGLLFYCEELFLSCSLSKST